MRQASNLLLGLLTATSLLANPVRVEIAASVTLSSAAVARFHLLQKVSDVEKSDDISISINAGGVGELELAPGYWSVDIDAPGFWHERQFVLVSGASTVIKADLVPSAVIAGLLVAPSPKEMPARVSIRFANAQQQRVRYETGQSDCPVADGRFRCTMPAGQFDVRVKAPGFVGRAIRGLVLTPAATVETGETTLRRGASIVGRVQLRSRGGSLTGVLVRAWPASVRPEEQPGLAALTSAEARCDAKGNFSIEAIPPGQYRLSAVPAKLVSPVYEVNAYSGLDSEIQTPLELSEPKSLRVAVTPPLDPDGRRWHVTLQKSLGARNAATMAGGEASTDGEWHAMDLVPGTYSVNVGMRDGSSVFTRALELSDSLLLPVTVDITRYPGRIRLGEQPVVAAQLTIDSDDVSGVQATSDAEGRFSVVLPRSSIATLNIAIRSEAPPILRTVSGIVPKNGLLDITLPNTIVMGDVSDVDGTKTRVGLVNILTQSERLMQVKIESDGSFLVHGLARGRYTMEAYGPLKHSRAVEFDLGDDPSEVLPPFHLVFMDDRKVLGRVSSDSGPVAGASVSIMPTGVAFVFGDHDTTGATGDFSLSVPGGSHEADVFVDAPGFGHKQVHVVLQDGMLEVRLDQRAGTLELSNIPTDAAGVLLHGGAAESIGWLIYDWPVTTSGDAQHPVYSIAMMEPGPYSLCAVPNARYYATVRATLESGTARCTSGYLPPFGTLALAAP